MLPNKAIHFVNGKQLCDQQYEQYQYNSGVLTGFNRGKQVERERIAKELASKFDCRMKPETVLAKIMDWIEQTLKQPQKEKV